MSISLPVVGPAEVRRAAYGEIRADAPAFALLIVLNVLAAGAGLVGPKLLGDIVDAVKSAPVRTAVATVDRAAVLIVVCTLAQMVLARAALYVGARFGERTAARIRERFVNRTLALPAASVEHIDAGDLITRSTSDVTTVAGTLRSAAPEVFVATVQILAIGAAVLFLDPQLGACGLSCFVVVAVVLRWYLRRARPAYLAQGAANSVLADVLVTTAEGARTVEAFGLQRRREQAAEEAIAQARRTGLATLRLRTVLYPTVDLSYVLPLVGVLMIGGALYDRGAVSLGTVIAATLYLRQLAAPMDVVLLWAEQLQSSGASYARVEGLAPLVREEPRPTDEPADDRIEVADVRFAYSPGADVLHGVGLVARPGERLALVGPSGAGKSTLGRLLAGIDRPRSGTVTVGGVAIADLPPDRLRRQVVLVTQEQHVFRDTLRNNLLLAEANATEAELRAALSAVGADWVADLPEGLDTRLGADAHPVDGAQAQQISLARVILADPHTVVLDEATALLDPSTARSTERALAAVLDGRTVIAIAHRLHTAHDADWIAVLEGGRVTELGTHDKLVAAGGAYAKLWRAWHGERDLSR
ncbi:ABC transporter ATP-binding protein [Streptomyces sp. GD-15H]|uniref:ABC transporter ATP-binding protein n=1 Tax=Streptomyces sp. GD-15H TaxID=3129112 RepID=UPI0032466EB2